VVVTAGMKAATDWTEMIAAASESVERVIFVMLGETCECAMSGGDKYLVVNNRLVVRRLQKEALIIKDLFQPLIYGNLELEETYF